MHTYITNESQIKAFPNVTRLKAARITPSKFAPNSSVLTDVQLDASGEALFKKAGQGCRVVYLKN
ncbi:hypothetical protein ACFOPQ_07715 [Deinococcus antarcticus]|uniref:Uncharacterized protein n=1 Tax=Deinococcus antarcticus TaxID=1298767 RepID=A0ABV8A4N5_9DEIO